MDEMDLTFNKIVFSCQEKSGNVTVNSEIFARILFSRKALKFIFATLKNRG